MRIAVLTGLFACTLILSLGTVKADAQIAESAIQTELKEENSQIRQSVVEILSIETKLTALKVLSSDEALALNENEQPALPMPITHVVTENETLTDIAKKYNIEWKRLFDKNTTLENPDVLEVGTELIVPLTEEVLAPRELPAPVVVASPAPTAVSNNKITKTPVATPAPAAKPVTKTAAAPTTRGSATGNGYVAGYCTWYVKNRRPDMPNNLGNAATWVSRAAAQGMATGSAPAAGAVGQRGNHVVYVESVNDDGTVTISEMNHKGLYVQTTRTLPANYFSYIY